MLSVGPLGEKPTSIVSGPRRCARPDRGYCAAKSTPIEARSSLLRSIVTPGCNASAGI